jgi:hypothetical protein
LDRLARYNQFGRLRRRRIAEKFFRWRSVISRFAPLAILYPAAQDIRIDAVITAYFL